MANVQQQKVSIHTLLHIWVLQQVTQLMDDLLAVPLILFHHPISVAYKLDIV